MIDDEWLTRYTAAWADHARAGGRDGSPYLTRLVAFMAADVVYEDVPSTALFHGHDGVAFMARQASALAADLTFEITSRQTDGYRFAFETVGRGTHRGPAGAVPASERPVTLRGVSIGSVDAAGLVLVHRDYWDMAALFAQLG